jgi:hypothetical protein
MQDLQSYSYLQSSLFKTVQNLFPSPYSGKRLFYTLSNTRDLISYNTSTKTLTNTTLSYLKSNLNNTSFCELPSGDLILSWLHSESKENVHLYKHSTQSCIRLTSFLTPMFIKSFIYHSGFIYSFGRIYADSEETKVERYNMNKNIWESLPNMTSGLVYSISPVSAGNKIIIYYEDLG